MELPDLLRLTTHKLIHLVRLMVEFSDNSHPEIADAILYFNSPRNMLCANVNMLCEFTVNGNIIENKCPLREHPAGSNSRCLLRSDFSPMTLYKVCNTIEKVTTMLVMKLDCDFGNTFSVNDFDILETIETVFKKPDISTFPNIANTVLYGKLKPYIIPTTYGKSSCYEQKKTEPIVIHAKIVAVDDVVEEPKYENYYTEAAQLMKARKKALTFSQMYDRGPLKAGKLESE
jgi:hypothetical protein